MKRRNFFAAIGAALGAAKVAPTEPIPRTPVSMSFQWGFANFGEFHIYAADGHLAMASYTKYRAAIEWGRFIAKQMKGHHIECAVLNLRNDAFASPDGSPSIADRLREGIELEGCGAIEIRRANPFLAPAGWASVHHV